MPTTKLVKTLLGYHITATSLGILLCIVCMIAGSANPKYDIQTISFFLFAMTLLIVIKITWIVGYVAAYQSINHLRNKVTTEPKRLIDGA
jgi:hypothetical protein